MQDHNSRFSALCAVRTLCSRGKHRCISDRAGAEGLKRRCVLTQPKAVKQMIWTSESEREKKQITVYPWKKNIAKVSCRERNYYYLFNHLLRCQTTSLLFLGFLCLLGRRCFSWTCSICLWIHIKADKKCDLGSLMKENKVAEKKKRALKHEAEVNFPFLFLLFLSPLHVRLAHHQIHFYLYSSQNSVFFYFIFYFYYFFLIIKEINSVFVILFLIFIILSLENSGTVFLI